MNANINTSFTPYKPGGCVVFRKCEHTGEGGDKPISTFSILVLVLLGERERDKFNRLNNHT